MPVSSGPEQRALRVRGRRRPRPGPRRGDVQSDCLYQRRELIRSADVTRRKRTGRPKLHIRKNLSPMCGIRAACPGGHNQRTHSGRREDSLDLDCRLSDRISLAADGLPRVKPAPPHRAPSARPSQRLTSASISIAAAGLCICAAAREGPSREAPASCRLRPRHVKEQLHRWFGRNRVRIPERLRLATSGSRCAEPARPIWEDEHGACVMARDSAEQTAEALRAQATDVLRDARPGGARRGGEFHDRIHGRAPRPAHPLAQRPSSGTREYRHGLAPWAEKRKAQ